MSPPSNSGVTSVHCRHRINDAAKKIRNYTHEIGESYNSKRFECFDVVTNMQTRDLINNFNLMCDRNELNYHICGLIVINNVQRRRSRRPEASANLRENAFKHKVRLFDKKEQQFKEIQYGMVNYDLDGMPAVIKIRRKFKGVSCECKTHADAHFLIMLRLEINEDEIPTIVFYGKGKTEVDVTLVQAEEALAAPNDDCSDIEDDEDPDYEEADMSTSDEDEVALEKEEIPQKTKKAEKQKTIWKTGKFVPPNVYFVPTTDIQRGLVVFNICLQKFGMGHRLGILRMVKIRIMSLTRHQETRINYF
ncbi:unnamed protein product [Diabrotica balteata]|uniref:Uncharacterized protein n=1 Tax=Diabrotica balteata TaxID=107213 RepID=A0A9P0GYZ1_DIABA|nr:unnamed protein product [Diabrotica balteata]